MLWLTKMDVSAAEVIATHTSGNYTYTLYDDGLLKMSRAETTNNNGSLLTYWNNSYTISRIEIITGVDEISSGLFSGFSNVTEVVIPNTVTSIGENAFSSCSKLENISIPSSVTNIGKGAFNSCIKLSNVNIPTSLTTIGESVFRSCGLTSLSIPHSVSSIGKNAFTNCSSLRDVSIPDSVTSIGEDAFKFCNNLTILTLPTTTISLGKSAFSQCQNLDNVTIPDACSLGGGVFGYCPNLLNVTISESKLQAIDTDGNFVDTPWLYMQKTPVRGKYYGSNYTIDKNANITFSWSFNNNGIIEGNISSYYSLIKSITFGQSCENASVSSLLRTFPNVNKLINYSSKKIMLYAPNGYSWCNIDDLTEPVFSLMKGETAILVQGTFTKHYKIAFIGYGCDGTMSDMVLNAGDTVKLPKCALTKDGYAFTHWKYSIGGVNYTIEDEETLNISQNDVQNNDIRVLQLTAVWERDYYHYKIKFFGNGATGGTMDDILAETDHDVALPPNAFVRPGYKVVEWKYDDGYFYRSCKKYNETNYINISHGTINIYDIKTITAYPVWQRNQYTIIFDGNGATSGEMSDIVATTDTPVVLPQNLFEKIGYKFVDWTYKLGNKSYSIGDVGTFYLSTDTLNKYNVYTIQLTASWSVDETYGDLKKGTMLIDGSGKETGYKVLKSKTGEYTAEYVGTTADKKKSTLSIKSKIKDSYGNTYTVTAIKNNAFKNNKKIKKLTIPKTVVKIGNNAFYGCKNLKKITINANPKLKFGKKAFKKLPEGAVIYLKGSMPNSELLVNDLKKVTNAKIVNKIKEKKTGNVKYILNTNTMKFHYPSCNDVNKIKAEHYETSSDSRDTLIYLGYSPCGHCKP